MNLTDMTANIFTDLSAVAATEWTQAEMDRAVDVAVAELSRHSPRELIAEFTVPAAVTDEGWITNHGTAVSLANKPIRWSSESVEAGFGTHLIFDGVNDSVTITSAVIISDTFDGGGTIELWVYPRSDGVGDAGRIVDKEVAPAGYTFYMENDDGVNVRLVFRYQFSTTNGVWRSDNIFPLNQWSHVVIAYDADAVANNPIFYRDSASITVTEVTTPVGTRGADSGAALSIGVDTGAGTAFFDGFVDEVRIWNDIRTATEVADNYKKSILSSSAGLVGYWKFDEGSGTTAQDATTNNNDGTITGATYGTSPAPPSDDTAAVRDTDYTIDYINGTITALATGNLADSIGANITYTIHRNVFDISSVLNTNLIAIEEVQAGILVDPVIPSAYELWGDWMELITSGRDTQSQLGVAQHVRIKYTALHTAPTASASGTYRRHLDEVVVRGAAGFVLRIKAADLEHQAVTDLASIRTAIARVEVYLTSGVRAADDALLEMDTELASAVTEIVAAVGEVTNALTDLTNAGTALAAIRGSPTEPLERAQAALDAVDTVLNAIRGVATDPFERAQAALNAVSGTTTDPYEEAIAAALLINDQTITNADARADAIGSDIDGVSDSIDNELDNIVADIAAVRGETAQIIDHLETDVENANKYLADGDAFLNQVNVGGPGVPQDHVAFAQAKVAMASAFIANASQEIGVANIRLGATQQRVALVQSRIAEINVRLGIANALVTEVSSYNDLIQSKIAQANAENIMVANLINEAQVHVGEATVETATATNLISEAQTHASMAQTRGNVIQIRVSAAQAYITTAQVHGEEAAHWQNMASITVQEAAVWAQEISELRLMIDLFTLEADRRLGEFRNVLRGTEASHQTGATRRQYSTSGG